MRSEIDVDEILDGKEHLRFESETGKSPEEIAEFEENVRSVLRWNEDYYDIDLDDPDYVMCEFMLGYARILSRDGYMDLDDLFDEMGEGGDAARMNVSFMAGMLATEGYYRDLVGASMREKYG